MIKGTRVQLTREYSNLPAGSEGVVVYDLSMTKTPFIARVKFDDAPVLVPGQLVWGMDDVGWLMLPNEIEAVPNEKE